MNTSSNFVEGLQDLMVQVPDLIQLVIVGAVAMVPFLEGELASTLGVSFTTLALTYFVLGARPTGSHEFDPKDA